ncbi:MAG: hypothetical protein KJZ80_13935 [Hyphomicrobiaceae bacterium]|nr:hypothetical protein [Hyphomicrobiaceae bacterium]
MATPAVSRSAQSTGRADKSFLDRIEVRHGPVAVLGRFFLAADAAARSRGVSLSFASLAELVETNEANSDSWRPLLPLFDDRCFDASPDNAFCVVGRDRKGRIVATHAARLYDWSQTNFHDEAESLRLFYSDPQRMRLPGEALEVTAPSARQVTGLTVFSGAAWYHPDFRGVGLSGILPRIGKAYSLTRWPAATIVSFMAQEIHARGFASRFGYDNVDWGVLMKNTRPGTLRAAILSVSRDSALAYIADFLSDHRAKIDARVLGRRA